MTSTYYACEYPGRSCNPNPRGNYNNHDTCSTRCRSRRDGQVSTNVLGDMISTYSSGLLELRKDPETGRDVVVATAQLYLGQRILAAPAAIVRGQLSSVAAVVLTLPYLLRTLEGLTDMPRPVVGEGLYLDFEDLVPREAITLAATVRNNAMALPLDETGGRYVVSVPYSVLPHVCDATSANAVGVVGHFPTTRLYATADEHEPAHPDPAVVVYAVRTIFENDVVQVTYGDCDRMTPMGLTCARTSTACPLSDRRKYLNATEAAHMRMLIRYKPFEANKQPNVYEPTWRTLREFAKAVRVVINDVQRRDPHVSDTDANAIVTMWLLNTGYGPQEWPDMQKLLRAA